MKKHIVSWLALSCLLALGACSSGDADLPDGWGGAARVQSLIQEECPNSHMTFPDEAASFLGGTGNIGVTYQDAHFRCVQKVEGYFKTAGDGVDILVQPIDMDPTSVAGCDCGYKITFVVQPVSSGPHMATLYRRWDNINHPNDPVLISAAPAIVQ
jgi:hypothetical protein